MKKKPWLRILIGFVIWMFAALIFCLSDWASETLSVTFSEIIFTLNSPLNGAGLDFVKEAILAIIPPMLCFALGYIALAAAYLVGLRFLKKGRLSIVWRKGVLLAGCIAMIIAAGMRANERLSILLFFEQRMNPSTLIEERYVDPSAVKITAEGKTKNLLYIYLESMETSYADRENGGVMTDMLIPNLTRLAKENFFFSSRSGDDELGGGHTFPNIGFTMGALFASGTGLPYNPPLGNVNGMSDHKVFAPGVTTLGDILEKKGYQNEFICGSDAEFGGRELFFRSHGNYRIFDLYTAYYYKYIPEDHYVWWGMEDFNLYRVVKDELTKAYESGQPFNITMLTVDTHYSDGYLCEQCERVFGDKNSDVIHCADRQLSEFIDWCKEQPFYEDTLIVITGDHMSMDSIARYDENISDYDRTSYNCWINCEPPAKERTRDRIFTQMDMFPTVLSAMGFEIEGDQLGLGVNLFSDRQTLAEEIGWDVMVDELSRYSVFCDKYVWTGKK